MWKRVLTIAIGPVVAGCGSSETAIQNGHAVFGEFGRTFQGCVVDKARALERSGELVEAVVAAALLSCPREEAEASGAARLAYGASLGAQVMDQARRNLREGLTTAIVAQRARR